MKSAQSRKVASLPSAARMRLFMLVTSNIPGAQAATDW
jgi:hypothetical protein